MRNRLIVVGFVALIFSITFTLRAQTPTPMPFEPVTLPNVAVLSPENAAEMQVVASIPASGFSVVLSPNMEHLFTVHALQSGVWYLDAFTFPDIQPVVQGIPIGRYSSPLFTADGQMMITVDDGDVVFYRPGDDVYAIDSASQRQSGAYALSPQIVPTTNVPDALVVDIATKAVLHQNALFDGVSAAYSPDGMLAYINNEVYETAGWQLQHILTFSPDGMLLFVLNTTGDIFEIHAALSE